MKIKHIKKLLVPTAIVAALAVATTSVFATKVKHLNVQDMATHSARIFVGICIEVKEGSTPVGNGTMKYTEYTFRIIEAIKGVSGATITFRQLGHASDRTQLLLGMPVYKTNQKYLLFLTGDSPLGLASPIGLFQSAFQAVTGDDGTERFINGYGNTGIFHGMNANQHTGLQKIDKQSPGLLSTTKGPVEADDLINLVKTLAK